MSRRSTSSAGKLEGIAAGSPQRLPQLPDVPTLAEAGLKDVDVDMWYGFFAPKGTPPELVDAAEQASSPRSSASPTSAQGLFKAQGLIPATSTPAALGEIVDARPQALGRRRAPSAGSPPSERRRRTS